MRDPTAYRSATRNHDIRHLPPPAPRIAPAPRSKPRAAAPGHAVPRDAQVMVGALTAWQRNQWARAGYPVARLAEFGRLQRGGSELYRGEIA